MFREIELTSGKTVKVYPVPPYVVDITLARYQAPKPPTRSVNPETAIPGVTEGDEIPDEKDPRYLEELESYNRKATEEWTNLRLVMGLKDEFPTEGWPDANTKEMWEFLKIDPVIPSDRLGKKLAWIKYDLLSSGSDLEKVLAAVESFASAPREEIEQIVKSFRSPSK